MKTVFFVGAGASAEAGYPVTRALTYAIADYLVSYRKEKSGASSRLEEYLFSTYAVKHAAMVAPARLWRSFVRTKRGRPPTPLPEADFMPSIIEILSVLDIAIAEGWSFGPSLVPRSSSRGPREFEGNELNRVRDRIIDALVIAFNQLAHARDRNAAIGKLAAAVGSQDAVVTTNWDILLDNALAQTAGAPPTYGTLGARLTDIAGADLPEQCASNARRLFKLHGSFNWQHCSRCGDLYVNTQQMIAPAEELSPFFVDRTCHCGARMDGLIVTPSFIKRYANSHLANIWRGAQRALESGEEWIFVGYSLPEDDLWIRAMLLRALAIRRGARRPPVVHVVTRREDERQQRRYRQLFPEGVRFHCEGLEAFLDAGGDKARQARRRTKATSTAAGRSV